MPKGNHHFQIESPVSVTIQNSEITTGRSFLPEKQTGILSIRNYPNPFNAYLTIEMKNDRQIQKIEILSLDGRILRILDNVQGKSVTIARGNLPSGLCFFRVHADKIYLKKVLVH